MKIKEYSKRDKYLDFSRELKNLWNMKVAVIGIVIGALETVPKDLVMGMEKLEIGRRAETIQTKRLLRLARKSLRDLRKFAIPQIPVKVHQLTLVGKTCK